MDTYSIEIIGLAAGLMNLTSSVPQLLNNLKNPDQAKYQSRARNVMQASGNALWLVYGLYMDSTAMMIFSALGCLMAFCLLGQSLATKPKVSAFIRIQFVSRSNRRATLIHRQDIEAAA